MSSSILQVLVVGLNYAPEPTGNAPYTAGLADGLRDKGHVVKVITGYPHYPQWVVAQGYSGYRMNEIISGIPVRRVRHTVPSKPTTSTRALMEVTFGVHAAVQPWGSPDVVICPSPALISSELIRVLSRVRKHSPAMGLWVQDLYSNGIAETSQGGSRATGLVRRFESHTLRAFDGVAVIHDRFRKSVVRELGVSEKRVRVIRNWTHLPERHINDRQATRAKLGWHDNETIALHAGNMGAKQGLENIIAAARVAATSGKNVRFVLLGDGNQRQHLETINSRESNATFLSPLPDEDYQAALRAADVLLVNEKPGVFEMSVPSKLTSYFTTGLPVIAAVEKGSITAEEIETSHAGMVIRPDAPKALVESVLRLASDKSLSTQLGEAGNYYSRTTLSKEAAVNSFDDWIHFLVEIHKARKGTT